MGGNSVYHIHVGGWKMFCGHKLDGGTRHRDEMWRILTCFLSKRRRNVADLSMH